MSKTFCLLLTIGALALGCAPVSVRVERSLLDAVPNEEKLLLFDAENGVYIAKDEMQAAEQRLLDAENAVRSARRYAITIEERKKSGEAIDTPEVLALLEQWNAARIEVRISEVALMRQRYKTAESRLWASRARYEKAKAILVKDFNPEAGTGLEVDDFVKQVTRLEEREAEAVVQLAESEAAVSERRAVYNELSDQLQQASGGAYGGPWADLLD